MKFLASIWFCITLVAISIKIARFSQSGAILLKKSKLGSSSSFLSDLIAVFSSIAAAAPRSDLSDSPPPAPTVT